MSYPIPANEAARLAVVDSYDIVGTPPEQAFDDLAELAAQICGCAVGVVNIVAETREWLKAHYGLPPEVCEEPRGGVCSTAICGSELLAVPDLTKDERFADYPFIATEPYFRSYIGMPLINPEGYALGTLCVLDFEPHEFTFEQGEGVRRLARQAVAQLELRRKLIELRDAQRLLAEEKSRSDRLLLSVLPSGIAEELMRDNRVEPRYYDSATIVFTDFKGFTGFAETMEPRRLIDDLDQYFSAFDEIVARHGLEKLKTIGDAYMCAGGLPAETATHAVDACLAALDILAYMERMNRQRTNMRMAPWELRIGIHTGPVMAGVVGQQKFTYDIWGDAVNIAAQMESNGEPGRINISDGTWNRVKGLFETEHRGGVEAKNKGRLEMYFLDRIRPELSRDDSGHTPNEAFASAHDKLRV